MPARLCRCAELNTGITVRVDQPLGDEQAFWRVGVIAASMSPDGRWVAFVRYDSSLVEIDGKMDAFLRDLDRGETQLITVNTNGVSGNDHAFEAVVSDDGRWVAFVSAASDLVPNDPHREPSPLERDYHNANRDVFLRDVQAGVTTLIVVMFKSLADNLIGLDFNDTADVFWASSTGAGRLTSFVTDIQAAAGERVTLWWRHLPGADYQVEFKDGCTSEDWQALGVTVTVEIGWARAEDLMPNGVANRYYRVRME